MPLTLNSKLSKWQISMLLNGRLGPNLVKSQGHMTRLTYPITETVELACSNNYPLAQDIRIKDHLNALQVVQWLSIWNILAHIFFKFEWTALYLEETTRYLEKTIWCLESMIWYSEWSTWYLREPHVYFVSWEIKMVSWQYDMGSWGNCMVLWRTDMVHWGNNINAEETACFEWMNSILSELHGSFRHRLDI